MEDHLIRQRILELLKEVENHGAKNEQEKPTRNGVRSGRFQRPWTRLQEIRHELEELAEEHLAKKRLTKKPPHSVRGNWSRDSGQS
ncbi:MAG: hypothetical protein JWO91_2137 [Acidobacteriaceae bacterium]|jgi:hypothetical protein|nr:hypothetical protein [Acidobacteriaceae bacterium]